VACITCAKIRKIIDNSAGDCSISLKFVQTMITWHLMYHELSSSTGQRSRSQRDITYQHKKTIIQARRPYKLSKVKLGENYSIQGYMGSNIEIAITPPRIARLRSNLVQSFITSQAIRCKRWRSKVTKSEVKVAGYKVMYQQQKTL